MGNEMGNNNTTGLKEEENLTGDYPNGLLSNEKSPNVDDVKQENHVVPDLADKDFHERVEDIFVDEQTKTKEVIEKEENGDFSPDDSLVVETGIKEEFSERSENQQALSPNEDEDENLIELNIDEIVPGDSENQLEKQAFPIKEEEKETKNSSLDPIPSSSSYDQEASDQHGLAILDAEFSQPDTIVSSGGTEQLPETEVLKDVEAIVDSESIDTFEKTIDESLLVQKKEAEEENALSKGDTSEGGLSNAITQSVDPSVLDGIIDEASSIVVSLTGDESLESGQEIISATGSPLSQQEIHVFDEKVLLIPEETRVTENELEFGQDNHDLIKDQPCEGEEPSSCKDQSIAVEHKDMVTTFTDFGSNKDCLFAEAMVSCDHEASVEIVSERNWQDFEADAAISPQLETIPSESKTGDCSDRKDNSSEKRIVEEIETLYSIEIDQPLLSSVQSDHQHELVPSSEMVRDPKKECSDESTFDAKSLIAEIIESMNEPAFDRTSRDVKQCVEKSEAIPSETKVASRESVERFSTDSDRDSIQYGQMRKSPSFSIDLQDEARDEESEQTPLLYQDKAEIQSSPSCQSDVSLGSTLTLLNKYTDQDQAMPVEEKVVTLERSDSEKSKTPFLGFLKEEDESQTVITPTKQGKSLAAGKEAKNAVSSSIKVTISSTSSSKVKEKRKLRSSLFGNCMCCATMIN